MVNFGKMENFALSYESNIFTWTAVKLGFVGSGMFIEVLLARQRRTSIGKVITRFFNLAHKSNLADHVILTTRLRIIHFLRPCIFSEMELEPVAG